MTPPSCSASRQIGVELMNVRQHGPAKLRLAPDTQRSILVTEALAAERGGDAAAAIPRVEAPRRNRGT